MTQLALALLGPFQAQRDDEPITGFESMRTRALLIYLAVEKARPHRREALVELLWPEHPTGVGAANLRHTLAKLRKAIGDQQAVPPFLLITSTTLQFNAASAATLDLDHFYSLLAHTPTLAALEEALALYRGRFLEGFALDGSPEFELWLTVQRERIDALATQVLTKLVNHAVQQGDFTAAVAWTQRQLALDALNEDLYMQLIWLLAHSAQRTAALHYYELCCQVLQQELGVAPQAALQTLVARIRSGSPDLGPVYGQDGQALVAPTSRAPLSPAATPPPVHLPTPATPFFGRTRELALVAERLADPACRLLSIVGPGGMGKTRLAIAAADAAQAHFPDGVYFVELVAVATAEGIPSAILAALAAPHYGALDLRQQLLTYLRDRQILLVLDNFEHLLEGAALLSELLQTAPLLNVMVTSRARLHLRQEWLVPLEGLDLPPQVTATGAAALPVAPAQTVADLATYDAPRFFLHCIRRLQPTFAPSPADSATILHICRLLAGMPLGLELAATWVRAMSLPAMVIEIEHSLHFLTTALRDMPARHRSMSIVFDHSWRLLTVRERSLLRQLAIFRQGCTRSAAIAVSGATLADLAGLVDSSWLRLRADERYEMHELTRQYCAEKLLSEHVTSDGETADRVHSRHCAYFAALVSAEEQALNWQLEPMAIFLADLGNIEAAWHWAVDHGDVAATRQMMTGLFFFAEMTGWFNAMIPFFAGAVRTLDQQRQVANLDPRQQQAVALLELTMLYIQAILVMHLGWLRQTQACIDQMHTVLATLPHDERWVEQDFLAGWATLLWMSASGNFAATYALAGDRLTFLEQTRFPCYPWRAEIGTRFWQMHMHGLLGLIAQRLGDYPAAQTHTTRAIALSDEMGELRFKGKSLHDLAALLRLQGNYAQARSAAHSGLELSRSVDDRIHGGYSELTLGQIELDDDALTLANEYCQHSLAVALTTGEHKLHIASLVALARIARLTGELAKAHSRLAEAVQACSQPNIPYSNHLAAVLIEAGHVAGAEADWPTAHRLYSEALAHKGCDAAETQEAYIGLTAVIWAAHNPTQATHLLTQVIDNPATAAATRQHAKQWLAQWVVAAAV